MSTLNFSHVTMRRGIQITCKIKIIVREMAARAQTREGLEGPSLFARRTRAWQVHPKSHAIVS